MKRELERLKKVAHWYNPQGDFDAYLIRFAFLSMKRYLKGGICLELGCSDGIMTELLSTVYQQVDVVDAVAGYISKTQERLRNKRSVHYFVDFFETFIPHRKYDDIIMSLVLEHVERPVNLLEKYSRYLKARGRIHIVVPNAHSLHRQIGRAMGLIEKHTDFDDRDIKLKHRRVYTPESLRRNIHRARLSVLAQTGVFLKPLSNSQMEAWKPELIEALFEVGKRYPEICTDIYACISKK